MIAFGNANIHWTWGMDGQLTKQTLSKACRAKAVNKITGLFFVSPIRYLLTAFQSFGHGVLDNWQLLLLWRTFLHITGEPMVALHRCQWYLPLGTVISPPWMSEVQAHGPQRLRSACAQSIHERALQELPNVVVWPGRNTVVRETQWSLGPVAVGESLSSLADDGTWLWVETIAICIHL